MTFEQELMMIPLDRGVQVELQKIKCPYKFTHELRKAYSKHWNERMRDGTYANINRSANSYWRANTLTPPQRDYIVNLR